MRLIWQSLVAKMLIKSRQRRRFLVRVEISSRYALVLLLRTRILQQQMSDPKSRLRRQNCTRSSSVYTGNLCGVSVAVNLKKESECSLCCSIRTAASGDFPTLCTSPTSLSKNQFYFSIKRHLSRVSC